MTSERCDLPAAIKADATDGSEVMCSSVSRYVAWKIDLLGLVRLRQRITGAAPTASVLGKNAMINEVEDVT